MINDAHLCLDWDEADNEDREVEIATQRLAKFMALYCFRETCLESLHSGRVPDTRSGDYSDVLVVTPTPKIPWDDVCRLSDPEMKRLMTAVVDRCYAFLKAGFSESSGTLMMGILAKQDAVPEWSDPKENGADVMGALISRAR
jgi:hypothetical protein